MVLFGMKAKPSNIVWHEYWTRVKFNNYDEIVSFRFRLAQENLWEDAFPGLMNIWPASDWTTIAYNPETAPALKRHLRNIQWARNIDILDLFYARYTFYPLSEVQKFSPGALRVFLEPLYNILWARMLPDAYIKNLEEQIEKIYTEVNMII